MRQILLLIGLLGGLFLTEIAGAASVVVTTTNDSGAGSLREALANGATNITFDRAVFPKSGSSPTISLLTPLPNLTGSTSIRGNENVTVQRDASATSAFSIFNVQDNGSGTGASLVGLVISNPAGSLTAGTGSAIMVGANVSLTVTDCYISNCASSSGSSVVNNGTLALVRCGFYGISSGSGAANPGGALENYGSLTMTDSSITQVTGARGAAFYNGNGTATIANCSFTGITTSDAVAYDSGGLTLNNCTFGNNMSATHDLLAQGSGPISLDSCTFVSNQAIASTAPLTVVNTIFKHTSSNPNLAPGSTITSAGYNLSDDNGSGYLNQPTDILNTDPMLDTLQENASITMAYPLLDGSPAIDHGNTSLTSDQIGGGRPYDDPNAPNGSGNLSDIGAYEDGPTIGIHFENLSTRLQVLAGDEVLIGGFIVGGEKKVLLRAIGPSLPIAGALADPILELHDGSGNLIATNDNWKIDDATGQSQEAAIEATTIPPTNENESALIADIGETNNTNYTVIVRGKNNGTGIGLVEIYDLDRFPVSRLENISTRGFVNAGDNVLIAGFITGGGFETAYFLRALGPSLPVGNTLQDPALEVYNSYGDKVASNDNWKIDDATGRSQEDTIRNSAFPPQYDSESALIYSFGPGAYTAIVRGKNNTGGVALVEVYEFE